MASKAELVKKLRDVRRVDSLILLPDDPRDGDVGAIAESFKRFGQQKPIVINQDGVILAGNHMYRAALALDWEEIWVNESELEGVDQAAYVLADNRVSDLATYNNNYLIRQLEEVGDLTGTGYDLDDLDTLKRLTEAYGDDAKLDPYKYWDGMPAYKSGERHPAFSATFNFPTVEDADRFFQQLDIPKRRWLWWPQSDGFVGSDVANSAWVADESPIPDIHSV